MNTSNKQLILTAAGIILAAALSRLLPHAPNFAPIGALGIFGGTTVKDKKYAFIFPLGALLISDIILQSFTSTSGFYGWEQIFVYAAVTLTTFLATRIKKANAANILLACVWTGIIFFLLSNFGVWVAHLYYPHSFAGLMQCYGQALVFYHNDLFSNFAINSIAGNVFFSALMFGAYALVKKNIAVPASGIA